MVREILSREFAGSEGRRPYKEYHIYTCYVLFSSTLGNALHHQFADKRDRNPAHTMDDFIGAGDVSAIEVWALCIGTLWDMLTGVGH
jgi:hypothetical protein